MSLATTAVVFIPFVRILAVAAEARNGWNVGIEQLSFRHGAIRMVRLLAVTLGIGCLLLVAGLAFRLWDNGRVRVHSAAQAVEMAKTAAGRSLASLPVRVEAEQDYWTVRFGPDERGQVHSYLVSIWDKQAGPVEETSASVPIELPN